MDSSEKWIIHRAMQERRGPGVQNAWTNCFLAILRVHATARTRRAPRVKDRPRSSLSPVADASWASGTRALIHSLFHSFCGHRPYTLSDRQPARSLVSVKTGRGDEGWAVPDEQQQATGRQHPPFPPTRPGLGRRPHDARPPAVSACVREPALGAGPRGPPALRARSRSPVPRDRPRLCRFLRSD